MMILFDFLVGRRCRTNAGSRVGSRGVSARVLSEQNRTYYLQAVTHDDGLMSGRDE